jgi:hypothetical protein
MSAVMRREAADDRLLVTTTHAYKKRQRLTDRK